MFFCNNCGISLDDKALSCPNCGSNQKNQKNKPEQGQTRSHYSGLRQWAGRTQPPCPGAPTYSSQPTFQGQYQNQYPGTPHSPAQWPQHGQPQGPFPFQAQLFDQQSPKSKNDTLILCWFFGFLGVHRFYAGRIVSGIIMLLTLGGLGIWVLIDFITTAMGRLKDGQGKLINKPARVGLVIGVIAGLSEIVFCIILMIIAGN